MYVGPVRRKKINLWLLLLIVLFIVAVIFTIIHITNSSKANSDYRYSIRNTEGNTATSTEENIINRETSGSTIGTIDSFSNFHDIEETSSGSENTTVTTVESFTEVQAQAQTATPSVEINILKVNNHTYAFDSNIAASVKGSDSNQYVELKKGNYLCRMNTSNVAFSELKSQQDLAAYIQKTYKLQVTSQVKSGMMNGNELIICAIAENNEVAYLMITPFNDSEVITLKVYNVSNKSSMLEDLSDALNDISTLKSCVQ